MIADQEFDLHGQGRAALLATKTSQEGRGYFEGARWLRPGGRMEGPEGADCVVVEEADLPAIGGLGIAKETGAVLVLLALDSPLAATVVTAGLRAFVRIPYQAGEPATHRAQTIDQARAMLAANPGIEGVLPTPVGEAMGLDTLAMFAACRAACPAAHVVVDLARLGFKLGQLCLTFGADELFGPIGAARALRLGENSGSPVITVKEAADLVAAAGLIPCRRLADGSLAPV
jgi:hypothetical protein